MKKILITGANSYIGTSFEKYISENFPEDYTVDIVDMIDGSWREKSFEGYDSVFHVAGIAHIKETKENAHIFYEINRDLAFETAKKVKKDGIKHFIFLSSMSVYGMDTGVITKDTVPKPKSNYGKSKLQAEEKIRDLCDDNFIVSVLRPPMIYGKGCKGNFQKVIHLVKKYPAFPKIQNVRSMLYIDNLCCYITNMISEPQSGYFFPQNNEYMRTSDMAKWIAESLEKKIFLSSFMGFGVKLVMPLLSVAKKAFGSLIYCDMEETAAEYCLVSLKESVKESIN